MTMPQQHEGAFDMTRKNQNMLIGLPVLAGLIAVALLSAPTTVQAQEVVLTACYVPDVGVVYRIKAAGLPDVCTETTHVEFSWNMEGPAGPAGPQGPQGEASLANLERVSAQFTFADSETGIPLQDGRTLVTRTTNCPPGKIVITGSSTYDGSVDTPTDFANLGGRPTANGLGWEALFKVDTQEGYIVTVWAICF